MFRKLVLATLATTGVLVVLDACTGDDPALIVIGGDSGGNGDPDGEANATDATVDPPATGPATLKILDALDSKLFLSERTVVVARPGLDALATKTDGAGTATLDVASGSSVSTRLRIEKFDGNNLPTRNVDHVVTYGNVEPADLLVVYAVPPITNERVEITNPRAPLGAPDGGSYFSAFCGAHYTTAIGDAPNISPRQCRIDGKTPILFGRYSAGLGSPVTHLQYASVDAGPSAKHTIDYRFWQATRDLQTLVADAGSGVAFPPPGFSTYVDTAYYRNDLLLYERVDEAGSIAVGSGVSDITATERVIYARNTRGAALGSIVRSNQLLNMTHRPARDLPPITDVAVTGVDRPRLVLGSSAPITDATGVEIVLSDDADPARSTRHWIVRLTVPTVASPLELPALPAEFQDFAPPIWKHVRFTVFKNIDQPAASVFRGVPAFVGPVQSTRVTARLRFPIDTTLAFTTLAKPL